jgi:hypothetical protein
VKIYCPLCRRKVEVKNPSERIVPINHGTRKMVEGIDAKGHKVAGFVSMAVIAPPVAKPFAVRKLKRKVRNKKYNSLYYM